MADKKISQFAAAGIVEANDLFVLARGGTNLKATKTQVASSVVTDSTAYRAAESATARSLFNRLSETVSPMDWGAAGDGIANDRAAMLAALESGKPVDGKGRTYAVSGVLQPTAFSGLYNCTIKQLDTAAQYTLYIFGFSQFTIQNVQFNLNGQIGTGSQATTHGLYVHNCANFSLENVQVQNGAAISGVTVQTCTNVMLDRVRVINFSFTFSAQPTDDEFHGIYLVNVSRFSLAGCIVRDQSPNWPGRPTEYRRWGRGIVISGSTDGTVSDCHVSQVDQGFDYTGSAFNSGIITTGCTATDCTTVGFKVANFWRGITYSGCIALRCGFFGFQFGGPTESGQTCQDALVTGCQALDIGSNGIWRSDGSGQFSGEPTGYRIMSGSVDNTYPRAVRFYASTAADRQTTQTMQNGFVNDVAPGLRNLDYDISAAEVCEVTRVLSSDFNNIGGHVCSLGGTTTQSIPNATQTIVAFENTVSDPTRMFDDVNTISPRADGMYVLTGNVTFEANATGQRGIQIFVNGDPYATVMVDAASSGVTQLSTQHTIRMARGNTARLRVFQNSGGALNINRSQTTFQVARIAV